MTIAEQIAEKEAARDMLTKEIEELQQHIRENPFVGIVEIPGIDPIKQVVAFTCTGSGVNINGRGFHLGYETVAWDEDRFHRFTGTIRYVDGQPVETKED